MSIISVRLGLLTACIMVGGLSAQPLSLGFKPVDIQYSKSLDRLIMVSVNPNRVHLVNPVSGTETTINLSLAPLSLSVSPDGTHAAVGHDGWISYVNLSAGYVEKNLAVSLTASQVILAGNGNIWVPPTANVNIATGTQTMSGYSPWGVNKPVLHPNGNWIYYTRGGSPDDVIKGDISSGSFQYLYDSIYHGDFPICAGIFYSADGNRLLTGCGTLFRTAASSSDDLRYNGALSGAPIVTAAADSALTHEFVVIPGVGYYQSTATDTEVQFYEDNYLALLGRVTLPTYTSGSVSAPWHGRLVYYSPDASKLYLVLQADSKANLTNDYALYTLALSTGTGCGPSLGASSTNVAASGGSLSVTVTATAGCLWQASSNATWLSVGAGGVSSGSGTLTIQAGPNLQTVSRTGTVTIAGLPYTVTQDAAAAAGTNPITTSPVRPIAADYSTALDRMILVSTNPDLLTIFDPVTGNGQTVSLVMPPTALSISPDGLHAAVGHDGRISYINLANATLEKTFPVSETVYILALGAKDIFAFPLRDQWEAVRVVNIASGTETLWITIYAGSAGGRITPNGKYLYVNAGNRYDVTQPLSTGYSVITSGNQFQWFSQNGSRLFSGTGQAYRLSDVASQDLQYNGTLEAGGLTAVADSSVQQVTATVASGATADMTIKFFGQQYLAAVGSISIPKFTSGSKSYDAHGRYLFWNAAGNRLFAMVQADQTSGFLNDYAIYTVSLNGSCNTSLDSSSASVPAAGGTFTSKVTADAGCAWKATTSASWLTISANAFTAGPATLSYIADLNPTTSARMASITVDGRTLTVTQAAGTQVQLSAVTSLPFRVADAEYSVALDRIVAISGSPSRLNIYDPVTATNTPVTLPLPGNAVSVAPNGLRAAVCHDGLVTVVNLQTATIEKSINVSVNCYDMVFADNGYAYLSVSGGWGSSSSVNTATGVETKLDLYYDGINFRLNAAGDAVYTSNTSTSGVSVTRYGIANGPMKKDYQSEIYPVHPFGYSIWFTRDGRMVADSGSVFGTGSTRATDFIYTGTLSGLSGYIGALGALAHSTTRHLFASVGTSNSYSSTPGTDTSLFLHGDKYFAQSSKMTLPKITVGGVAANSHGKFVFWDSTGAKAYVILQADSSAGFMNDYATYTLSPDFTPGCAVALGINSGTAIGYADTGGVAVNAASDCIWEVKSNASWIQIDTGTLGVGAGNVGFSVLANCTSSARTGTITIGTQTFTITQAAIDPSSGATLQAPVLVTPVNAQTGVSQTPTLIWGGVTGACSYDVYLGSANNPPLVVNTSTTSYTAPAALAPGATYYWRVAAKNPASTASTATLSFATGGVPSYAGAVDTINCQTLSGWAADRNRLNTPINVSVYDNTTLLGSALANGSRSDVGSILGDNGLHGFTYILPSSVRDGLAHSIRVVFESSASATIGAPKTLTCATVVNYSGAIDSATCNGITGWAADRSRPSTAITVTLWDGATQVASATANGSRPDVGSYLGDNGLHGYSLQIPASYANGISHTLQVHYETSTTQVGPPPTLICGGSSSPPNYVGAVDVTSCSGISGWVADRNRLNTPITVSLWDGQTQIASTSANGSRGDVGAFLGDNGVHGFSLAIPAGYADGVNHTLQVRYESSSTAAVGSAFTLRCGTSATPNYVGFVDASTCSGIAGWVADRNRLNTSIAVTLWDGATQIASATANGSRSDVGSFLGDNGLHGYSLQLPSNYANGVSHTLQVRFETSNAQLGGSPTALTCGGSASPNYTGAVDQMACTSIFGWAGDRNNLNTSINVGLYDGTTLLLSATASGSRPDVGAFLGDNGLHGYGFTTPAALKDGHAHSVSVRAGTSGTTIVGTQSLTCP